MKNREIYLVVREDEQESGFMEPYRRNVSAYTDERFARIAAMGMNAKRLDTGHMYIVESHILREVD